jgi:adenylate kinase family enzyme
MALAILRSSVNTSDRKVISTSSTEAAILVVMRRISVVGTSGSGKSWLATRLAARLAFPYLELDAIRHQKDWQPLPDAVFVERVRCFVEQDAWVVDGNYFDLVTGPVIWPAADTVVWVDLPKSVVMGQVTWRTLRRWALRQELWNGNREHMRDVLSRDPYRSIIRWTWTSHATNRQRYQAAMEQAAADKLTFIRLSSQKEMREFLERPAQFGTLS